MSQPISLNLETVDPVTLREKIRVLLYVPNLVDYARILAFVCMFTVTTLHRPLAFSTLYLICFALDGLDGYAARQFNQVSGFGAFLDVTIDNSVRALAWALALPAPFGVLVPCLEWMVFAATQALAGAAWKSSCFKQAPSWVTAVTANGFRNPAGILVVSGLHFLPLWLWLHRHGQELPLASWWIGAPLLVGRALCLAVEAWVLGRFVNVVLEDDCRNAREKEKTN